MTEHKTLWSADSPPDQQMLAYTVGDDRQTDTRLLHWDVLGSLGHLEALKGGDIVSTSEYRKLRRALLAALDAVEKGTLSISASDEDCHSAVELWLTRKLGKAGEQIHVGRSRNDQVTVDLRLYLKDATLTLHHRMIDVAKVLIAFGRKHRKVVWPGYTHQRVAMPSGAGIWATGFAEQLLDTAESIGGIWPRVDRSPLGSAAGYGVPLPLDRNAAAKALGFSGLDVVVTGVQNSRGQLEAGTLFWCSDAAHALSKLSADVILYSADNFGWLILPDELSTGSSIMPQKRNPDLFELTRARASAISGELASVMAIRASLPGGYHRDFQLIKSPLFRGLDRLSEMLGMIATAIPRIGVDSGRAAEALSNEIFATDEAVRRFENGDTFRSAYRTVASQVKAGESVPRPSGRSLFSSRLAEGGLGNPGFASLGGRATELARWNNRQRKKFEGALQRLTTRAKR